MTRILLVPDLPRERWPSMDRYASRLAAHLPPVMKDAEIAVAGPIAPLTQEITADRSSRSSGALEDSLVPARISEVGRYLSRYVFYPMRVRRQRADLVHVLDHSYAHLVRTRRDVPTVVTVHDLLPLVQVRRRAATLRDRIRNMLLRRVLAALREARAWVVSTEWLRGELAEWLEREEDIHVIPFGVDDAFCQPGDGREETRERLGIPLDRFVVLHVGSVGERKNIAGVIAAVDGLRKKGIDLWLLQVGGTFTPAQEQELQARTLSTMVTQLSQAAEPDLRAAYHAADALLFPSHYEGFGFPVIEAMASGLPVVTSGAAALAEVAGDAATIVEGRDPERYVVALERIATDRAFAVDLSSRGRERAKRFRWTETARRTAEVYRSLV